MTLPGNFWDLMLQGRQAMNCYNFCSMKTLALASLLICGPLLERPEWWLVGVGIITCIIIACQSWETGKAAQAAKEGAKAALQNAQSLINSERAWVLVELKEMMDGAEGFPFITQGQSAETGPSTRFHANIILTNEGRSPCWITDVRLKFEIVESLPEEPDFASQPTEGGCVGTPLGTGRPSYNFVWMPTFRGRESATTMTAVYGIIKYRDIFNEDRTTTFGFKVVKDGLSSGGRLERLTDYPKYNKPS
jgi:hypothetical protein